MKVILNQIVAYSYYLLSIIIFRWELSVIIVNETKTRNLKNNLLCKQISYFLMKTYPTNVVGPIKFFLYITDIILYEKYHFKHFIHAYSIRLRRLCLISLTIHSNNYLFANSMETKKKKKNTNKQTTKTIDLLGPRGRVVGTFVLVPSIHFGRNMSPKIQVCKSFGLVRALINESASILISVFVYVHIIIIYLRSISSE